MLFGWTFRQFAAVAVRHGLPLHAAFWVLVIGAAAVMGQAPKVDEAGADAARETEFLAKVRQLTFEGRRAGEGYFSADGRQLVFQSEREPGNPFFQIYVLDLETGDVERVSPGTGKTTCAWIHPQGQQVLFASTHDDPAARQKQDEELRLREEGKERRYSWDYDDTFELYVYDRPTKSYTNLTRTRGYDAEGSWSPDGRKVVFASNRQAYERELNDAERTQFELDPAVMMELYLMDADGANVRRLTDLPGYDGGPFFSPDGQQICWRHFAENGATAEIMTMRVDGTGQKQLTQMGAMSWAPFFHPSGEYLIFTTNRHGFGNFELYLIDVAGQCEPVRVTYTDGFDGLPVFTPDGQQLAWTANRTASKQSQIFLADWNHEQARKRLGLDAVAARASSEAATAAARAAAAASSEETVVDFSPQDIMRHVDYLCRPELTGRMTGTEGEQLATAYVAAYFDRLGLQPAGDDGSWFQEFEFTAGAALGPGNALVWGDRRYAVEKDWVPVSFSRVGDVAAAPVVFAGYGLVAPATGDQKEYDSYVHLDVTDKWVILLRFMPENVAPERRQHLSRFQALRYKAMIARDKGARGLIVVSGPSSQVKHQLIDLRADGSLSGASLPVVSVTDEVVQGWLAAGQRNLQTLQEELDNGEPVMGFELPGVQLSATIDIEQVKRTGRNVVARLAATSQPAAEAILVGAHIDHLGQGPNSSSLAREDEKQGIHMGADDNASGVSAMLEMAQYLSDQLRQGKLTPRRDVLFAAWSGEEMGMLGSNHYVKALAASLPPAVHPAAAPDGAREHPKLAAAAAGADPHASPTDKNGSQGGGPIYPAIAACLNLDMVGRLDKQLILQGIGSSSFWRGEVEKRNAPVGLPITLQDDSYIPSDGSAFFMRGVPMLSAFTGSHSEYHTPRDTPSTLNYEGAAKVARLMALITRSLATRDTAPDYIPQKAPAAGERRANLRAYLGTIPDYAEELKGVKLSGVGKGGPAEKAGIRGGDVIVELAGRKIENIYDYTYAIEALKTGQKVKVAVQRDGKRLEFEVTPGSRD